MDHSIAPHETHVFKLDCPKCQKKVKELFLNLNGDYSIKIDGEAGKVSVTTSTMNPNQIREHSCGEAQPPPPLNEQANNSHVALSSAAAGPGNGQSQLKGFKIADLHKLAKTKKLKRLEFTQTKNLRMTFCEEGKNHGPSQKGSHKSEPKKVDGPIHLKTGECVEMRNLLHCAETGATCSGGPYYTPLPYHHAVPPNYHGYPYHPPPHYGYSAPAPPPPPPPLRPSPPPPSPPPPVEEKANDVGVYCDNGSTCRMM